MSRITRGTTPYHRFNLPIQPNLIDKIYITYLQGKDIKVEKSKSDIQLITTEDDPPLYKAVVHLTQQDTLKFDSSYPNQDAVEIQMDIKTTSAERIVSKSLRVSVGRVLKDEEI